MDNKKEPMIYLAVPESKILEYGNQIHIITNNEELEKAQQLAKQHDEDIKREAYKDGYSKGKVQGLMEARSDDNLIYSISGGSADQLNKE